MLKTFLDGYDQGYAAGLRFATTLPGEEYPSLVEKETPRTDFPADPTRPAYRQGFVDGLRDGAVAMAAVSTGKDEHREDELAAERSLHTGTILHDEVHEYFRLLRRGGADLEVRPLATRLCTSLISHLNNTLTSEQRGQGSSVSFFPPEIMPDHAHSQVGRCACLSTMDASSLGAKPQLPPDLFAGSGMMGDLLRAYDWTASPLGPMRAWPASLHTVVSTALLSPSPFMIFGGPKLCLLYNEACLSIFGDQHPASFGQPVYESWPETWPFIGPALKHVMSTGQVRRVENLLLPVAHEGNISSRYFTFSFSPIREETGTICGVFCPLFETTEYIQREELLTELQRMNGELQQFSHIVSHDLAEPVRTIQAAIELHKRQQTRALDPDTEEMLTFLSTATLRLQHLLRDLLAYTRVGQAPEFQAVACEAVLEHTLQALRVRINECRAVITHEPLPTVEGDAIRLALVFQNLIDNALKFCTAVPPRIHIAAMKEAEHWRFTVQDNGIGIPGQQIGRLFQIFQRVHGKDYPGSGLGLAICKRIVEQHGGHIWVESLPGQGSTFVFTLRAHGGHSACS